MNKENLITKSFAKGMATVLKTTLKADANSNSCVLVYQPKVPKELEKYRKRK